MCLAREGQAEDNMNKVMEVLPSPSMQRLHECIASEADGGMGICEGMRRPAFKRRKSGSSLAAAVQGEGTVRGGGGFPGKHGVVEISTGDIVQESAYGGQLG